MEKTFVAIKPDGLQRGLVGAIVSRFEAKGFQLVGMKLMRADNALAERHYSEHREKPFFHPLVEFITSAPLVAMVWQGEGVVSSVRLLLGSTNGLTALPGTIRGDYGASGSKNLVHASDGLQSAEREINLFFEPGELLDWNETLEQWIR